MIKFFKKKGTEIRKAATVDADGKKSVIAVIGQAEELAEIGLIEEPRPGMNEHAWLAIETKEIDRCKKSAVFVELTLIEHETLEEAKDYIINKYEREA